MKWSTSLRSWETLLKNITNHGVSVSVQRRVSVWVWYALYLYIRRIMRGRGLATILIPIPQCKPISMITFIVIVVFVLLLGSNDSACRKLTDALLNWWFSTSVIKKETYLYPVVRKLDIYQKIQKLNIHFGNKKLR